MFIEPETLDKVRKEVLSARNKILWDCYSSFWFFSSCVLVSAEASWPEVCYLFSLPFSTNFLFVVL